MCDVEIRAGWFWGGGEVSGIVENGQWIQKGGRSIRLKTDVY